MSALYVHGLPGGPGELAVLTPKSSLIPLDYLAGDGHDFDARLSSCADALTTPTTLVGFSLGAMMALRVAGLRPEAVERLILIAPASPLSLGDFLADMAGRPVFEAAAAGRMALAGLTAGQAASIRLMPRGFIKALFAGGPDTEMALLDDKAFVRGITQAWRFALSDNRRAYCDALVAYVPDWQDELDAITCPVEIHYGTTDTWVPPAMAKALAQRLGAETRVYSGLGHYSTARTVLRALS